MIKYFFLLLFISISCKDSQKDFPIVINYTLIEKIFSNSIADSFTLFIKLPNDYQLNSTKKYPVVYLLDANYYFDSLTLNYKNYLDLGLIPPVILVGIGYKDLTTMDSLRNRDYTYPIAMPEYEMKESGGADKFLTFFTKELIPFIDKKYASDTSKRILSGHSLGGYFSCYCLLQNLQNKNKSFSDFIAASPSFDYNKYYLLDQFKQVSQINIHNKKLKLYVTFGSLEDEEELNDTSIMKNIELISNLSTTFSKVKSDELIFKWDTFHHLAHMETQLPSFLKGLQWILK